MRKVLFPIMLSALLFLTGCPGGGGSGGGSGADSGSSGGSSVQGTSGGVNVLALGGPVVGSGPANPTGVTGRGSTTPGDPGDATAVPEPATGLMLLCASGVIAAMSWRKRALRRRSRRP